MHSGLEKTRCIVLLIYIYKAEILSVCLSVRPSVCHAVNSPGTVDIAISTA